MKTQSLNRIHHCDISNILIKIWKNSVIDLPKKGYEIIAAIINKIFVAIINLFFATEIVNKDKPTERNE